MPTVTFALTIGELMENLTEQILSPLIGILMTAALVAFFYGVVKYLAKLSSDKDRAAGKDLMIWGVVALFVMVSVWGLVNFIRSSLDLDNSKPEKIVLP